MARYERYRNGGADGIIKRVAPVAQWIRASVFGTEGRGFESLRVYHQRTEHLFRFLVCITRKCEALDSRTRIRDSSPGSPMPGSSLARTTAHCSCPSGCTRIGAFWLLFFRQRKPSQLSPGGNWSTDYTKLSMLPSKSSKSSYAE